MQHECLKSCDSQGEGGWEQEGCHGGGGVAVRLLTLCKGYEMRGVGGGEGGGWGQQEEG